MKNNGMPASESENVRPSSDPIRVAIAVLTFRRPDQLMALLDSLNASRIDSSIETSVYVFNNAPEPLDLVLPDWAILVEVGHGGVARGRNSALEKISQGGFDYLAFVDDDQVVSKSWIWALVACARAHPTAVAVAGPVQPIGLSTGREGLLYRRAERSTGELVPAAGAGNLLLNMHAFGDERFDSAFDRGGEDTELTMRLTRRGLNIVWCNEAECFESVPAQRLGRRYRINRAMNNGAILFRVHHKLGLVSFAGLAQRAVLAALSPVLGPLAIANGHLERWWLEKPLRSLGYLKAACWRLFSS